MATRIKLKCAPAVNIWMKFTVLQRRYGTWLPVHEYYKFSERVWSQYKIAATEQAAARPRYVCPGCERQFTAVVMAEHRCHGGTEAWPALDPAKYKRNQGWRPTSEFDPITYKELK